MSLTVNVERIVAAVVVRRLRLVVPVGVMMEVARELHAVDVAPLRVFAFVVHVAAHGIGNPRLDALDEVLIVDRAVDAVFAERRERNDVQFALPVELRPPSAPLS